MIKPCLEAMVVCVMMAVGAGCVTGGESSGNLLEQARPALQRELDTARQALYGTWPQDAPVGLALMLSDGQHELFLTSHLPAEITADSHYRIASMTKTFTAAAVLLLVQEGKIRLDDHLGEIMPGRQVPYVPATEPFDFPHRDQMTVRQLLQHTSGIYDVINDAVKTQDAVPYANGDYIEWMESRDPLHRFTVGELVGVQARHRLTYGRPGEDENYSNVGFALLTLIVERAAQMDYAEFVKTRLLQPNGLTETSLVMAGADWHLPRPFLRGYRMREGKVEEVTERNASAFVGSGNMVSTFHDIQSWLRRLNEGRSGLNQAMVMAMQTCNEHDYGLGTRRLFGRAFGHGSHLRGYFGCSYYDRKTGLSWVLMCNAVSDISGGHGKLFKTLQAKLLKILDGDMASSR